MHDCLTNAHSSLRAHLRGTDRLDITAAQSGAKYIHLYIFGTYKGKTTLLAALHNTSAITIDFPTTWTSRNEIGARDPT